MRKLTLLALVAGLGACTNYATTATPEAKRASEKSLPSNGNGNGHANGNGSQERMTFPELGPTWTNPPLPSDPPISIGGKPRSQYTDRGTWSPAASAQPHGAVAVSPEATMAAWNASPDAWRKPGLVAVSQITKVASTPLDNVSGFANGGGPQGPSGGAVVDCPEVDPAQARCSSGSGMLW